MQTVHSISLERLVPARGEPHGYRRDCGEGSLHSLIKLTPGSQQSRIGVPFASTSQVRAKLICRHTRKHRQRAFSCGISPATSSRRSLSINRAITAKRSGSDSGSDKRRLASAEDSPLAKEEVMLLFYQLEIEQRLQKALNKDQYETAQVLREKIAEFEQVVARQKQMKMGSLTPKEEVQDTSIKILQLRAVNENLPLVHCKASCSSDRTELQKSIEQENYAGAARLRDKIAELEAEALLAAAKAKIYENIKYTFRLGQKVIHKIFGYRGVICGMDPVCFESEDWIKQNAVEELDGGAKQPFYQVLVDVQSNPSNLVAYVAETNLLQPKEPDLDRFDHPYTYYLFYGVDSAGDFIPVRQLLEKYRAPRHEVPLQDDEDSPAGNDGDSI